MKSSAILIYSTIVASVFTDKAFVNDSILSTCSLALHRVIAGNPQNFSLNSFSMAMLAFSNVLALGREITSASLSILLDYIETTVFLFQNLKLATTGISISTPNIRFLSYRLEYSASTELRFQSMNQSIGLTIPFIYRNESVFTIASTVQFLVNVRNQTLQAPEVFLYVQSLPSLQQINISFQSVNFLSMIESSTNDSEGIIVCQSEESAYEKLVDCGIYGNFSLQCPAWSHRSYRFVCPKTIHRPLCLAGSTPSIASFSIYSKLLDVSSAYTECAYYFSSGIPSSSNNSLALGFDFAIEDLSFDTSFVSVIIPNLPLSNLSVYPATIVSLYVALAAVFICTLMLIAVDVRHLHSTDSPLVDQSISSILDGARGVVFGNKSWQHRYWGKLLDEHRFLHLFMPRSDFTDWRTFRWVLSVGSVTNAALLAALFSYFDNIGKAFYSVESILYREVAISSVEITFLEGIFTLGVLGILSSILDRVFASSLMRARRMVEIWIIQVKECYTSDSIVEELLFDSIQMEPTESPGFMSRSSNMSLAEEAYHLIDEYNRIHASELCALSTHYRTDMAGDILASHDVGTVSSYLRLVRRDTHRILKSIEVLSSVSRREMHLLQEFTIYCHSGSIRELCRSLLPACLPHRSHFLGIFCLIISAAFIIVAPTYIAMIALSFDSDSFESWETWTAIILALRLLFSQPSFIFLKYNIISVLVRERVQKLFGLLTSKCLELGDNLNFHQYPPEVLNLALRLNPAFRAAMKLTNLRTATLICCLSDDDLAHRRLGESKRLMLKVLSILCTVFYLPSFIHDSLIEAIAIILLALIIVCMYLAITIDFYLPLLLICFVLILIVSCFYIISSCERHYRAVAPGISFGNSTFD